MAIIDEVRASIATREAAIAAARVEIETRTTQLTDLAFQRMRSVAAISWANDVDLREACRQFSASLIQAGTQPGA